MPLECTLLLLARWNSSTIPWIHKCAPLVLRAVSLKILIFSLKFLNFFLVSYNSNKMLLQWGGPGVTLSPELKLLQYNILPLQLHKTHAYTGEKNGKKILISFTHVVLHFRNVPRKFLQTGGLFSIRETNRSPPNPNLRPIYLSGHVIMVQFLARSGFHTCSNHASGNLPAHFGDDVHRLEIRHSCSGLRKSNYLYE